MAKKIIIINGSYRDKGFTDVMLDIMKKRLTAAGIAVETVVLRETPIAFCQNCRYCTQSEGSEPGKCSIEDGMEEIIQKLEAADGYIFASPTNYGTVTAIFKRFLERMTVYAYWPWGTAAPAYRKKINKVSICVSSCAAPSLIGRVAFTTLKTLKMAARNVGAKIVDTLLVGLVAGEEKVSISSFDRKRIERTAEKLIMALM